MPSLDERIVLLADASAIARYGWADNDPAPHAYIRGMAIAYARAYRRLLENDPLAVRTAAAEGDPATDALAHYRAQYHALGMNNSEAGEPTLRHVFVLLLGLGIRESSGKHCAGRDAGADNVDGETAEAGLFQVSYNAMHGQPDLRAVYDRYAADSIELLDVFSQGVHCSASSAVNWGDDPGRDFQRRMKTCPALAVEFAALGLRLIRHHWGPINRHEAELRTEADDLFRAVRDEVDAEN